MTICPNCGVNVECFWSRVYPNLVEIEKNIFKLTKCERKEFICKNCGHEWFGIGKEVTYNTK